MGAAVFGALLGPVIGAIATVAGVRATFLGVGAARRRAGGLGRGHAGRACPAAADSRSSSAGPTAACSAGCGCWCCPRCCSAWWPCSSRCASTHDGLGRRGDRRRLPDRPPRFEMVLNPLLGRFTDRRGYMLPVRVALVGSARGLARLRRGEVGSDRGGARRRGRPRVRRLLHPGDDAADRRGRAARDLGGTRLRSDERRVGGRQRRRPGVRRLAGRACRRRSPLPPARDGLPRQPRATGGSSPRQLQPSSRPSSS